MGSKGDSVAGCEESESVIRVGSCRSGDWAMEMADS